MTINLIIVLLAYGLIELCTVGSNKTIAQDLVRYLELQGSCSELVLGALRAIKALSTSGESYLLLVSVLCAQST